MPFYRRFSGHSQKNMCYSQYSKIICAYIDQAIHPTLDWCQILLLATLDNYDDLGRGMIGTPKFLGW